MHRLLKPLRSWSLTGKITLVCMISIIGALSLTLGLFQWQDWLNARRQLIQVEMGYAIRMGEMSDYALSGADPELAGKLHDMFQQNRDAVSATYFSATGRRIDFTHPGGALVAVAPIGGRRPVSREAGGRLFLHFPILKAGKLCGETVMVVALGGIWATLCRNLIIGVFLATVSAVLAAAAARAMVKATLRPLDDLERSMLRLSEVKDFSIRVEPRSDDELGRLTRDFNELLAELASYDSHLKGAMAELTAARNEAEDASIAKSQFLANMSHEIRTPLNGVLGMAQVMAMNPLSAPQRERLEVIQKSGVSLLSVLNDLLDISKIEAGRMDLEQAPFDIEEVAQGAYATFTGVANSSGVSFSMAIAPEARGMWEGDSVRVRQVLYNLISNALKFTTEGHVEVRIDAAAGAAGKALVLTVADTGIGIEPHVLSAIFEKFVQADNTTTRRFGGTGLGLTICRHLVELLGGRIEVESQPGSGTTFRVLLPLPWLGPAVQPLSPPAATDSDPVSKTGLDGLRVLAAEDNATNQLVMKTVLHSLGLNPVIVENGRQALEAWETSTFDLVLMDIQMPVMDGVAAAKEIRRREAESEQTRTPIVALSANAMNHQVAEYLGAGMDGHLAKPIQIDKLYAVLLEVARCAPSAIDRHNRADEAA